MERMEKVNHDVSKCQLLFSASLFKLALHVFEFCTNLVTVLYSKVVALLLFEKLLHWI